MRSSSLKKLDTALSQYGKTKSPGDRDLLRSALMAWIGDKGSDWKSSIRNKDGAVDTLYKQVMGIAIPKSGLELVALSHLQHEQQLYLNELFFAAKLENRPAWVRRMQVLAKNKPTVVRQIGTAVYKANKVVKSTDPGHTAESVVTQMIDGMAAEIGDEVKALLLELMPGVMADLAREMAPYLGLIVSGGSALLGYKALAQAQYRQDQSAMHAQRMLVTGDPEHALAAITVLFQRERNSQVIESSINTAAFGAKAAGCFLDLGTASTAVLGLASTLASLANLIRVIVRDCRERKEANALMQKPIEVSIFQKCPIVGAYFVCCVPTSALVNVVFARWWQHGVKAEIERSAIHHINPMRESARALIRDYRFEIKSLQKYPGVMFPSKEKLEHMKDSIGTGSMESYSSDDFTRPRR